MLLLKRQSRLHVALSLKDVFDVDSGKLIEKGPAVFSVNCRILDLFGSRPVINNAAMLLIALFRPEVPETARKNYVNLSKHLGISLVS